jgi:uncharacterized protein
MNAQTLSPESQNQKWGFFSTVIWSLVILALIAGSQLLTILIIYGNISKEIINKFRNNDSTVYLCVYIASLIGILIMCGVVKLKKNSNIKEYLAINRISLKQVITWSFVTIIFIIIQYLKVYFQGYTYSIGDLYKISPPLLLFIAAVMVVPLCEELFFRGFLFSGFSSSFLGPVGTIIVTSLLWAAGHFSHCGLLDLFLVFIFGLAIGTARYKTNSIFTTLMMHSLSNLVTVSFFSGNLHDIV